MRIALAQINCTVGDLKGNVDAMIAASRRAVDAGAELVVFPELAVTGYPPRDLLEKQSFVEQNESELRRLARATAAFDATIITGFARRCEVAEGRQLANSAAVLEAGEVLFVQDKVLLPNYDVFDEQRYFRSADKQSIFALRGRRAAIAICEDAWNDKQYWERRLYSRDPVEDLLTDGADMLVVINASPWHMHKRSLRRDIFSAAAGRYGIPIAYVNQVGGNDQLVFDGSSFVMSASGELIASAASFREDLVIADLDTATANYHPDELSECEAVYDALVLGTRDYIRKCGFQKVLLGLSGGIDSSLVAVIAADAVGPDNVTGVGMPGPYSSPGSVDDARALAENLGIGFELISIGPAWDEMMTTLGPLFASTPCGIAEENLQSRLRGVTLMALSNKWGALVLTTGNKSELAVGYCTLYGDMCGGLAVISDVPKTLVYEVARVANRRHGDAIPESVFTKPPSAELRPDQKDTDSLPEYPVLDSILRGYVEQYKSAAEIAKEHAFSIDLVRDIINKVDRNEYKRQQAAPGLKVTSKAFGIGRRFPIAQRYAE